MRNLVVDGVKYEWLAGRTFVRIRCAGRLFTDVYASEVKGISVEEWERAKRKRTGYGAVTPSDVAAYIRKRSRKPPPTKDDGNG